MDPTHLAGGFAIGFSVAATFGPISLLCVRRTVAGGWAVGLASGLGVASADATYGGLAAFGLSIVTATLVEHQRLMQVAGGLFLAYLGLSSLRAGVPDSLVPANSRGLISAYLSTYALTLANPLTILSFAGIFAGLGLGRTSGELHAATAMVVGVFAGSALWWLVLTGTVARLHGRISPALMRRANTVAGVVLLGFAGLGLLGAARG